MINNVGGPRLPWAMAPLGMWYVIEQAEQAMEREPVSSTPAMSASILDSWFLLKFRSLDLSVMDCDMEV